MNVLVTGGLGYIGSVLTQKLLNENHTVTVVDNLMYNNHTPLLHLMQNKRFRFRQADVTNINNYLDLLNTHDVVIPLAAIVGAPACAKDPSLSFVTNYGSIVDLVNHAPPDVKILYPNTSSSYGISKQGEFCDENTPSNPISEYSRDKCGAEEIVLKREGSTVFRLATVFGLSPRMRFDLMVNDFCAQLVHNKQITLFEPDFRRNFVHVQDVARAFIYAIDNDLTGVYNLGLPSANLTKLQLAAYIADRIYLKNAVKIGDGEDKDKRDYFVSNDKILHAGFNFKYPKDTIDEVIKFAKELPLGTLKKMGNV